MAFLHPGQPVRKGLYWVAGLYGLIIRFRLWCYRNGWLTTTRLPCRVVSVAILQSGDGKNSDRHSPDGMAGGQGATGGDLEPYKRTSTAPYLLVSDGSRILAYRRRGRTVSHGAALSRAVVAVGADRVAGRWYWNSIRRLHRAR